MGPLYGERRVRLTQTTCGCGGARQPLHYLHIGREVERWGWCHDDILGRERTEAGVSSWLGSNFNLPRQRRCAWQRRWGAKPSPPLPPPPPTISLKVSLLAVQRRQRDAGGVTAFKGKVTKRNEEAGSCPGFKAGKHKQKTIFCQYNFSANRSPLQ